VSFVIRRATTLDADGITQLFSGGENTHNWSLIKVFKKNGFKYLMPTKDDKFYEFWF
jgi:hypothetical protein